MIRIILSACVGVIWTQVAFGQSQLQPGQTEFKKETIYNITGSSVDVTTTSKDTNEHDEVMTKYLLPTVKKALTGFQYITDVQAIEGTETREDVTWADYTTFKRASHVFVSMNLPARVSMLFKVEEDYRRCKTVAPAAAQARVGQGSWEDGVMPVQGSNCQLQSSLKVTGPVAVYGSYATAGNVDQLLKNKQELTFTLSKSWDKTDAQLITRLNVNSMRWEDSLFSFMQAFNIKPQMGDREIGPAGSRGGVVFSRQMIFLGVARFARQINERILP